MLLSELYEYYGSWTRLVRDLNIAHSSYQVWRRQGYIPFKAQLFIEHQTNSFFKACEAHGKPEVKEGKGACFHPEREIL